MLSPEEIRLIVSQLAERLGGSISAPEQRYLTVEQAGLYTGLATKTIRKLLAQGTLKAVRFVPGAVRVDVKDLDRVATKSTRMIMRRGRGIRRPGLSEAG